MNNAQTAPGFGYESPHQGDKDEWLTPPEIIEALGSFDLDPCAPVNRPWSTATTHYTVEDNGLLKQWRGRVWCNPPYGPETGKWMSRMIEHGDGIALIFARTETAAFWRLWECADAFLFIKGRLKFYNVDGTQGQCATAPSVLVAFGSRNVIALKNSGIEGALAPKATLIRSPKSTTPAQLALI